MIMGESQWLTVAVTGLSELDVAAVAPGTGSEDDITSLASINDSSAIPPFTPAAAAGPWPL